jgi:hypothetical protein
MQVINGYPAKINKNGKMIYPDEYVGQILTINDNGNKKLIKFSETSAVEMAFESYEIIRECMMDDIDQEVGEIINELNISELQNDIRRIEEKQERLFESIANLTQLIQSINIGDIVYNDNITEQLELFKKEQKELVAKSLLEFSSNVEQRAKSIYVEVIHKKLEEMRDDINKPRLDMGTIVAAKSMGILTDVTELIKSGINITTEKL